MTQKQHNRTIRAAVGALVASALLALSAPAVAQQKGVITIREITIVGRVQKPIASVDVNKIQPKLTLAELRQPFLDKIEAAVLQEPF